MKDIKPYEIAVLHLLVTDTLSPVGIDTFVREAEILSCEYTGSGYYLSLKHPGLPKARQVCNKPTVMGSVDCGFVIFIENGELTIECHTWGTTNVPKDFREKNVRVTAI